MKKLDIKTGMILKTADGKFRLMVGGTAISTDSGGIPLSWFNEDLELVKNTNKTYEIVEIYAEPKEYPFCADFDFWLKDGNFLAHTTLLWKKEVVTEMSIEDLEKKYGIKNLKIVKS